MRRRLFLPVVCPVFCRLTRSIPAFPASLQSGDRACKPFRRFWPGAHAAIKLAASAVPKATAPARRALPSLCTASGCFVSKDACFAHRLGLAYVDKVLGIGVDPFSHFASHPFLLFALSSAPASARSNGKSGKSSLKPQNAVSMPLFIGVPVNCVCDPRVLPPRNRFIEVCPAAAQRLNRAGPCAESADLLIDGLDSAAMDAPCEEEHEAPTVDAFLGAIALVHPEEANGIPTILDRRDCVRAVEKAQGDSLELVDFRPVWFHKRDFGPPIRNDVPRWLRLLDRLSSAQKLDQLRLDGAKLVQNVFVQSGLRTIQLQLPVGDRDLDASLFQAGEQCGGAHITTSDSSSSPPKGWCVVCPGARIFASVASVASEIGEKPLFSMA